MMHDRGKSDSAIVAVKPTNNAGQPAAEPVEPRAGTKRNAGEQSTHRTQGRTRVTQALARVRKAAQQRRKEKFTALFHHISVDLLREAFFVLKHDAAPGIDGLTWQTYAADQSSTRYKRYPAGRGTSRFPYKKASAHARVCDHAGSSRRSLMARPCVWPSTFGTVSAPRMTGLSRLNGWPAHSPADAS